VWGQQGSKLVGTGAVGGARQGFSVSLSSDGKTAIVGGRQDNSGAGAAWVYAGGLTSVKELGDEMPGQFALEQNYPNPFNPSTTIRFNLPISGHTTLRLYNLLGQEVETLVNGELTGGAHSVEWNPGKVASGVYFYRLVAGSFVETKKMLYQK
jgi:hypothetical protein